MMIARIKNLALKGISAFFKLLALFILYMYKYLISPLLPKACRFYPTCSTYAVDAIKSHGIFSGFFLILKRIGRCHPWHQPESYFDPVPCNHLKEPFHE